MTASLGYQYPDQVENTLAEILGRIISDEAVFPRESIIHHAEGVDLLPANIELSGLEVTLVNTMSREILLREYLNSIRDRYDVILMDCCPSLGMMTINALAAADEIIIPVQAHYLSLRGMEQLIRTISNVKRKINPKLEITGIRDGEGRGFTSSKFKAAQTEGWEKQYQYKLGKKKVYMTPSAAEAQGLERASKYPKSTKYGRQNPITARWNSEEQLVLWRAAWAHTNNRYLEKAGREERIDHRSHAECGLDEQPTIHEGVAARAMERKGIVSDGCELNRQIKADNALLRELKSLIKKLMDAVKNSISAIAESMESLRQKMIIFGYQLLHIKSGKAQINKTLQVACPDIRRYEDAATQLKFKVWERRILLGKRNLSQPFRFSGIGSWPKRLHL